MLESEQVDQLPSVCVRDGWPAVDSVTKTLRTERTTSRLFRYSLGFPFWLFSLLYRRSRQVDLPVCDKCRRRYRIGRMVVTATSVAIPLCLGLIALKVPRTKIGPTYLAPDVYLLSLVVLPIVAAWLWRYPAYGVVRDQWVRLRVSPHFNAAFRNVVSTPVSSLFAWPAPGEQNPGGVMTLQRPGAVPQRPGTVPPPASTRIPRHATSSGERVTGVGFHAKRLGVAVAAIACLGITVARTVHDYRPTGVHISFGQHHGARLLSLSDLPRRFTQEVPGPQPMLVSGCDKRGWDAPRPVIEGHVYITANKREVTYQTILSTDHPHAAYRNAVRLRLSCHVPAAALKRLAPTTGPRVGDESSWWRQTLKPGWRLTPAYESMPKTILFMRRGDTVMEIGAKTQQQVLTMEAKAFG